MGCGGTKEKERPAPAPAPSSGNSSSQKLPGHSVPRPGNDEGALDVFGTKKKVGEQGSSPTGQPVEDTQSPASPNRQHSPDERTRTPGVVPNSPPSAFEQIAGLAPGEARRALLQLLAEHHSGRGSLSELLAAHGEWTLWLLFERCFAESLRGVLSSVFGMSQGDLAGLEDKMKASLHEYFVTEAGALAIPVQELLRIDDDQISEAQFTHLLNITPGMVDTKGCVVEAETRVTSLFMLADSKRKGNLKQKECCSFLSEGITAVMSVFGILVEVVLEDYGELEPDSVFEAFLNAAAPSLDPEGAESVQIKVLRSVVLGCVREVRKRPMMVGLAQMERQAMLDSEHKTQVKATQMEAALYMDVLCRVCEDKEQPESLECAEFSGMAADVVGLAVSRVFQMLPKLVGGSGLLASLQPSWTRFLQDLEANIREDAPMVCEKYFELLAFPVESRMTRECFQQGMQVLDHRLSTEERVHHLFDGMYAGYSLIDQEHFVTNLCHTVELVFCLVEVFQRACLKSLESGVGNSMLKAFCAHLQDEDRISKVSCLAAYKLYKDDTKRVWKTIFGCNET